MQRAMKFGFNNEFSNIKEKEDMMYNEMVDAIILHKQAMQFSTNHAILLIQKIMLSSIIVQFTRFINGFCYENFYGKILLFAIEDANISIAFCLNQL